MNKLFAFAILCAFSCAPAKSVTKTPMHIVVTVFPAPIPPSSDRVNRCRYFMPLFERLSARYGCHLTDPVTMCALWNIESGMSLGASRGEPVPASEGGAVGCIKMMPETWATWGRDGNGDGTRDPQQLEDSIASAMALLCHLNERVGTQLVFRAYNEGPSRFTNPIHASIETVSDGYDSAVRESIAILKAELRN